MDRSEIMVWLREPDEGRLAHLWELADRTRRKYVGDAVHLRGLVEFSNHCVRQCAYCGLRAGRSDLVRYRMTPDEVLDCAERVVALGYGTIVLQSGEDPGVSVGWMAELIAAIKARTPLAVTLSLGERDEDELAAWRRAGADRYLLRFETSDRSLYDRIHPPRASRHSDRIALLRRIRGLGYEVGSGVMIGIPGQTYESLADDILLFRELDLDMIGVGPFIVHPGTPLGQAEPGLRPRGEQVPCTESMTYKVLALARLVCPRANIPSTTALATLDRERGRELGLARGANVVMPNVTPVKYRTLYEIYPSKACLFESAGDCYACIHRRIASIGRTVGRGRGDSPNYDTHRMSVAAARSETGCPEP